MEQTNTLKRVFAQKLTENGDTAYSTTGSALMDILFMTEYYQQHLDEVPSIGDGYVSKLFSMFIRDPRFGIGRRDLGRKLMKQSKCDFAQIVKAGRYDDLWAMWSVMEPEEFHKVLGFLKIEIETGNELAKKWMPRYNSKNLMVAREIAKCWGMNKQQYGHFIKCSSTVESKLSSHKDDSIKFEHVPSLAAIKYNNVFKTKETMKERYAKYMEDVKAGKATLHVATTTPYDIYKNANKLAEDTDVFFDKLEKISGSWIPVVDTSSSMIDDNDSFGKAMAIGHYLAKCSTYMPNHVISFSSRPQLVELGVTAPKLSVDGRTYDHTMEWMIQYVQKGYCSKNREIHWLVEGISKYADEIRSMYTGDTTDTNFGAVMSLLRQVDPAELPEYLVVLSDMEFNAGSNMSKDDTMKYFRDNGINTRIIWWNFNSRSTTTPEMDTDGNIFISGYNPLLLKYMEAGFDGPKFLEKLLEAYADNVAE